MINQYNYNNNKIKYNNRCQITINNINNNYYNYMNKEINKIYKFNNYNKLIQQFPI